MAAKKKSTRSADAAAGAAAAKAKAKAKATGQTAESSMDAASRRYKTSTRYHSSGKDTLTAVERKDRLTGKVSGKYTGTGRGKAMAAYLSNNTAAQKSARRKGQRNIKKV